MSAACTAERKLAAAAASLRVWLPSFAIQVLDAGVADQANGPVSRRTEVLLTAVAAYSEYMSTLQHVQSVVDTVFRPLAKYATDDDTVVALLVTIHEVINLREVINVSESLQARRSLFGTAGVRDEVFIPLAKHVHGPETCDLLLQAMCCLSTNADCVKIFVTAAVRDRILIPLVRHATNIRGQRCLFLMIMNFFSTAQSQSGDVLGTPAVRDRIFVAASVSPECLGCYFHALSVMVEVKRSDGTYGPSPQAALFSTQAVRDRIFLPLAPLITVAPTVQSFLRALTRITAHSKEGAVLFGTKAVRDQLFIPVSKHVSNAGLASLFFALLYLISEKCPRNVFGTQPFRDKVILPLASCCGTSSTAAGAFTGFLFRSISDTTGEAQRLMHTAAMRDEVFIPLARHVNSHAIADNLCKLVAVVSQFRTPGEPSVFATDSVRDAMVLPFARVVSDKYVAWVFRLIGTMMPGNVRYKEILATPEIRDEVFCRHAVSATKSQAELVLVTGTLSALIEDDPQGQRRSVFATARVRDEVLVPLFERSTSLAAIRKLSGLLAAFGDIRLQPGIADLSVESLPFNMEVLVRLAARATTIEHATRLACLVAGVQRCHER